VASPYKICGKTEVSCARIIMSSGIRKLEHWTQALPSPDDIAVKKQSQPVLMNSDFTYGIYNKKK
jgi:hypothetical protein